MILRRFYDDKLAQASYLIGCARAGEAIVVDPNRDVNVYLRAAESEGVRITHVTETHIHADFVSGSRELASRTGAKMHLSREGGDDWQYAFGNEDDVELIGDGSEIRIGNVVLRAMHTPGHTPEHLSFLVTDGATGPEPMGILTGDFVFVGDVGRPDLLEKAARVSGTMEDSARLLFRSIQRFLKLPDYLQIWPGHGAGSACGKGLSAVPTSTVGYERRYNWALQIEDADRFVEEVLKGQPEPPKYFVEMKRINKAGPPVLGGWRRPQRLAEGRLEKVIRDGEILIDTRSPMDFAAGHIPGSLNVPLNNSFNTWAGWLIPYSRDFYLIIDATCMHCLDEATRDLAMIGLDQIGGYFGSEALSSWSDVGHDTDTVVKISGRELEKEMKADEVQVVDVRGQAEWEAEHIPGSLNIPVGLLTDNLDRIAPDRPVVVHCQTGGRSAIAASVLEAEGYDVMDYAGGFSDWKSAGRPTVSEG